MKVNFLIWDLEIWISNWDIVKMQSKYSYHIECPLKEDGYYNDDSTDQEEQWNFIRYRAMIAIQVCSPNTNPDYR